MALRNVGCFLVLKLAIFKKPARIGSFRNDDSDSNGNGNGKNAIALLGQKTSLHMHQAFFDYDVKMPNFTFYGGRK